MQISQMNWMQVEAYLQHDDRCVLPLGSTEQHAYLSLSVDSILADTCAKDAAEPLGVPVFPVVSYGMAPYFQSYPGTITLRIDTYISLVRDILNSMYHSGFRRIVIVNGHGGNSPVDGLVLEWMADHPGTQVKFHNWWRAPKTWAAVKATDPLSSHASWMENFPWTRLPGVTMPTTQKVYPDRTGQVNLVGDKMRAYYGDGNYEGVYQRPDDEMLAIWDVAVSETRSLISDGWDN
jgi:creatinine amidohydrolase